MTDPKANNSTTLPSISHLLNPTSQERIASNASAKNTTCLRDPSDPACSKQNHAYSTTKLLQDYPSPPLSSSALDYPTSSIPPLQGNDPPPRHARTISNDSDSTMTSLSDTQRSYQRFSRWGTSPTSMQYFHTPISAPWTVPKDKDAAVEASSSVSKPSIQVNPSTSERLETPAPTRLSFTSTGEPILKRRRGRPPSNAREACTWEGGWTFLSPTVWSVNNNNSNQVTAPPSTTLPVSSSSSGQQNNQPRKTLDAATTSQQQSHSGAISDIAAFSSSDLSNVMHMPKRKRGRKPKKHLVGHSCFVWKDIPIVRSPLSTAKARATAAANRLRKEKERQEQQKQKQQENVLIVDDNKVHHEDSC
ncbi:hypothetical protein O0I10_001363 [Lichtheimia ornata]|uniref:Uncharacterized protein n=1 Tax=Lichtheimia ornata TaxID=688661 RepID=A0AAD7Y3P4_9FUNG|nr:uncharacterized protein O0I10_001363 [Lichtheimia ornata]KAJ8663186.1 hypothetical protein O0I10_001363 [Lichtheimia ornata]